MYDVLIQQITLRGVGESPVEGSEGTVLRGFKVVISCGTSKGSCKAAVSAQRQISAFLVSYLMVRALLLA